MAKLMEGKKGIILGVANDKSIAWGIAQQLADQGAVIGFNYTGDIMIKRVTPLAESVGAPVIMNMNVQDGASMDAFFEQVEKKMGKIDFMLHSIAFSNKDELRGEYLNTTRENFLNTMDISVYSFTELCRRASKIMNDGGACLTMTYMSHRVMPNYNVMGVAKAALESSVRYLANDLGKRKIRVNAISAGPIKTLAASGISDFKLLQRWNEFNTPLKQNVTTEDVGKSGLYLLSDLSSGVTGEVHFVDAGYNIMGMMNPENAKNTADLLNEYANRQDGE